ncbi:MAG TPA: tetratricopeptide repeat protein [Trinickia sp.]|jgi:tetratricopeptide (TPR) repeat protein|uniref:tetratricopeptide repeat protein n=1 Tax=Trinickia sp. TaxID=2571163 RepID=UPI002B6162A4|nr:tetratricopeptide repeat protein [Trinickia sp.]HTI16343.1 tetratricopeptide repeat protein [Trinickia sp.]
MIVSLKLLLSKRAGSVRSTLRGAPLGRIAGAIVCASSLAALALPAHAQVPAPVFTQSEDDAFSAASADGLSSSLPEETSNVPNVSLSSQIVFQVLAAEIALQRNQPAPAYQTYLSLARDTHDPRMAQRAAEIAIAAQSPADALTAAQLWREYAPDSERASQLDASLLVLSGKPEDAQPLLAAELAKIPEADRGNAILALQVLFARGPNRVGGLAALKDLLQNDMGRPQAQLAIGRQQLLADDQPGARASFQRALKLKPDYLPAALALAQMDPDARNEAISSFESYVKQNPKSRDARLALAQLYLSSDRIDDAQKQFETLHSLDSHDAMPLMALGLIKIQQKQYNSAQNYLQQYIQITEKTPGADAGQAYLFLAQIAIEQNNEAQAAKWLDKVSPDSPRYIAARVTRAQLLAKSGKVDDARKILADLDSPDPRMQALIARTDAAMLFDAKRYPEAEARLAAADDAMPDDPEIMYDYAMAAEKNGNYDLMETKLRQIIKEQPDNPQAYNALGYSLADRNQKLDEAEKLIEKASTLAPNDAFIMDSLGWVKYRQGDTSDALKLLRRAFDLQPNAEIGAHLGEVLWKSGDQAKALSTWRDARKLDPDNDTLVKTLKRFQVDSSNL